MEVTATKPGNVHRFGDLHSLHFLDFLLSAAAIAGPLDRARSRGLGETILEAVKATRRVVSTNTNLGILLLLAPLAAVDPAKGLAEGVEPVLSATTVEDARLVYQAIRIASPGGLGHVVDQDLAQEPTVPLRAAMALAADRDLVARQYADGFQEVLFEALPLLRDALLQGQSQETAIITTFLGLLSHHPDSLIVRKQGPEMAAIVSARAADIIKSGWPDSERSRLLRVEFDDWLRLAVNRLNPGTTADLVTASIFAALREGTIPMPRSAGRASWAAI
jgi:triphosphoribosyl-dephospho-CoA synthase